MPWYVVSPVGWWDERTRHSSGRPAVYRTWLIDGQWGLRGRVEERRMRENLLVDILQMDELWHLVYSRIHLKEWLISGSDNVIYKNHHRSTWINIVTDHPSVVHLLQRRAQTSFTNTLLIDYILISTFWRLFVVTGRGSWLGTQAEIDKEWAGGISLSLDTICHCIRLWRGPKSAANLGIVVAGG